MRDGEAHFQFVENLHYSYTIRKALTKPMKLCLEVLSVAHAGMSQEYHPR